GLLCFGAREGAGTRPSVSTDDTISCKEGMSGAAAGAPTDNNVVASRATGATSGTGHALNSSIDTCSACDGEIFAIRADESRTAVVQRCSGTVPSAFVVARTLTSAALNGDIPPEHACLRVRPVR